MFLCRQPDHGPHHFLNHVPADAPVDAAGVETWIEKQKAMRLADLAAGKKKAGA